MSTLLRIAGIVKESIVDGPGIRLTVFAQGCRHNCPGCHNPQTHDFCGGTMMDTDSLLEQIKGNPILDGITLSGGEPFEQADGFAELARRVHELKLHVMTYTGYTYEELIAGCKEDTGWRNLLDETDILVDGRFELNRRNILLKFRGSENQRLIDVKKSKLKNNVVEID